ncbi:MAG: hypothetical protein B7X02_01005 [Rhodospirillales bacterium 12-54-5]|nr:MAG: hypothetical protein B7X02_01005 [Rhodospirillales bacterium 12-54-5]
MSSNPQSHDADAEITQKRVIEYLQTHPQFLDEHPDLFEVLTPPEQQHGRGVIDFQYYAIDNLRRGMRRMKDRFQGLVVSARENLSVQQQVQRAVLSVVRARTLEELLQVLSSDLMRWFDVDVVRLGLESDMAGIYDTYYNESNYSGICFVPPGTANAVLLGESVRLIADTQGEPPIGFEMLFADCSSLVRSCALVRLDLETIGRPAVLAFGVRHADRFHPHQGGELLAFFGEVMSLVLDQALSQSDLVEGEINP